MTDEERENRLRLLRLRQQRSGAVPPTHSEWGSTWRGGLQGATGDFLDEIAGVAGKLFVPESGVKLGKAAQPSPDDTPEVRAEKEKLLAMVANTPTSYELTRNLARKDLDAARKANPELYAAGQLGGGVLSAAVPGMAASRVPVLAKALAAMNPLARVAAGGAAYGALSGTGASEADTAGGVLADAAIGAGAGAGAGMLGHGIGRVVGGLTRAAGRKVAGIKEAVDLAADKEAKAATASARSQAGRDAQETYRHLEHLRELGRVGRLTPEQAAVRQRLEAELADKSQEALLGSAARKDASSAAYREAMETEAQRAAEIARQKLGTGELKGQVGARFKRYVLPAIGGATLSAATGHSSPTEMLLGAGGGALSGAGLRPMMHSLLRMGKQPVVQHALWRTLERAGGGVAPAAAASGAALVPGSRFAQPMLAEALRPEDEDEARLARLTELRRRAR